MGALNPAPSPYVSVYMARSQVEALIALLETGSKVGPRRNYEAALKRLRDCAAVRP